MSAADAPIAVIGTGVIGSGWAALFLAHGREVLAFDPAPGAQRALRSAVDEAWPALTRLGLAEDASRDRLRFTSSAGEAVADAVFVQENGPEQVEFKQRLFAELDEATPMSSPIASSSSGLAPSQLRAMCRLHPERVLVGHPFHPTYLMPLVEVVPSRVTERRVVEAAVELYTSVGKRPIVLRQEVPGHIANRLQAALWREAYSLVERGVATVADVDTAISHGPGLRWALLGPLVNQHLSGGAGGLAAVLEHLGPPAQAWMDDLGEPRLSPRLAELLVDGVDAELHGIDQHRLAADRDALLVELLERKALRTTLP